MINPNITGTSADCAISEEACISLPDERGKVRRHKSIVVEYTDLKGHKQKKKFKDFNATIIQHEIDHLD
jgi:peptide deformylase